MFGKILKLPFTQGFKGLSAPANARFFGGAHHGPTKVPAPSQEVDPHAETTYDLGSTVYAEDQTVIPKLTDVAHLHYKKYPNVDHNDPHSEAYIHSERDEYADNVRTKAYNYIIDRLKSDIEMQADVYQVLEGLDRPWKRGVPGVERNITGGLKDYYPPEDIGFRRLREKDEEKFFDEHYNNIDRWANQAVFYAKYSPVSSDLEWQKELENRPVTHNYHPEKGYKYDVEVPWNQRFPHVADRRGYPEILGTPWERLLRLEGEIFHPTYLDQPFVQIPTSDPHESLNFEEGEVVYENTRLLEWAKFWNYTGWSVYAFCAFFIPYNLLYKTHMPLPHAYDNLFVPYYTQTMFFWDNWTLHAPLAGMIAMYGTYLGVALTHTFWKDYVVKAQFSKDKELLFVTRISAYASLEEEVYEVQHLEALPPSVKVGTADLSSQDADGLWDVTCLATHRSLVLYNQDKYWNPSQRKNFFDKVFNLWTPDVVEPNRLERLNEFVNRPEIELGGNDQIEASTKRLEAK